MFLAILGVIVFLVGMAAGRNDSPFQRFRGVLRIGGLVLLVIGLSTACIRQIEAGSVGVVKLFGQVEKNYVLGEGLHPVNPLSVIEVMNIRQLNYTMSSVHDEGNKGGDDAVRVQCSDGLSVAVDMTVLYSVVPMKAPNVFQMLGVDFEESYVRPIIRSRIRDCASSFSATDLYSGKRSEFEALLRNTISNDFQANGFFLNQVLVRNILLPQTVTESIERKIAAIQEAQRQDYVLEKVKKEAEMKRQEAQGTADAQRLLSAGLSDKILQYESIKVQKELVNSPNSKIIIMGGKSMPLILDGK